MRKLRFAAITLFSVQLVFAQQFIPGEDFGYTKGTFTVSDAGAAIYNVPLIVAPGLSGLQPNLSVAYNSQGGNGPLGVGWSIGGLSVISRTARTQAQDPGYENNNQLNFVQGSIENTVNFNMFDRYSLDGEQLRLAFDNVPQSAINTTYGLPNTNYFTEQNNFSKVIIIDTLNGSPTYFKVFSKDGLIMEYGNTLDSRIELSSNNLPIQWLINSIEDRNGNFIRFKYFENTNTGEYYPLKIEYSGNSKVPKVATDSVVFVYETREDNSKIYYKGAEILSTKRLKEILCYSKEKIIRKYQFTYIVSSLTHNSLLVQLKECGLNNKCLTPTTFQWDESGNAGTYPVIANNSIPAGQLKTTGDKITQMGDFNGDGHSDIFTHDWTNGNTVFWLSNYGAGTFTSVSNPVIRDSIKNGIILLADFNADGRSDILFYDSTTGRHHFYLCDFKSNTLQFIDQPINSFTAGYLRNFYLRQRARISIEDFTNDGLPDLVIYKNKTNGYVDLRDVVLFRNTGDYNVDSTRKSKLTVGKLDFEYYQGQISMGEPIFPHQYPGLPTDLRDSSEFFLADLDNNSYPDYFLYNRKNGTSAIYYNYTKSTYENNGFFEYQSDVQSQNWNAPILNLINPLLLKGNDSTTINFVDINSDALPDLVIFKKDSLIARWFLNKGNFTFVEHQLIGVDLKAAMQLFNCKELSFLDHNYDGKTDIIIFNKTTGENRQIINTGALEFTGASLGQIPNSVYQDNKISFSGKIMPGVIRDYFSFDPATGNNQLFSNAYSGGSSIPSSIVYIYEANGRTKALSISYGSLTDTFCYKRNTFYTIYPNVEIQNNYSVVTGTLLLDYPNGMPMPFSGSSYQYEGATVNLNGRGFRGFSKIEIVDGFSSQLTIKHFFRDTSSHIYIGDPIFKTEVFQIVHDTINFQILKLKVSESDYKLAYQYYPTNHFGLSFHSYTRENTSKNFEISGTLDNTTRTRQEIDYYGNPTMMVIDYGNGYKDSTINEYYNDVANWILGRLINATVYRFAPGKPVQIRNSSFEYDNVTGQLTKEISYSELDDEQRIIKTYQYDVYGNITHSSVTAWTGEVYETRTTSTEYDPTGKFIIKTTNPLGHFTLNEYDNYTGKLTAATDANNLKAVFQYDDLGRLKKQTTPDGNWTSYDYKFYDVNISSAFPQFYNYAIIKQTSLGEKNIEFYDGFDRQFGAEKIGFSGKKIIQEKEFGFKGLVNRESRWHYFDEPPIFTEYKYDAFGRQTVEIQPGNRIDSVQYSSRKKVFKNSQGQTKTVFLDHKDQIIKVVDNAGKELNYDHDPSGNLLKITDPKGNNITNEYDLRDNKIKMIDPDLGTYTYSYNGFGELIKQTDAAGRITELKYDILGRVISRTETEGTTSWTYDLGVKAIGKLSIVTNYDSTSESFTYDTLSRQIESKKKIDGRFFSVRTTYDSKGRVDTLIYPSGFRIRHVYNSLGFLFEVRRATNNFLYWRATKVNAVGLLESQLQANNVLTEYAYNSQTLFLDSLRSSNNSRFFNRWQFTFSGLGNLLQRTNSGIGKTETFEYDGLNRLTKTSINGANPITIAYDELGNITSKSDVGVYEYGGVNNGPHRVTKITLFNSACVPSDIVNSEFTSFNKVKKVSNDSSSLQLFYDHNRQRNLAKLSVHGVLTKTKIYVDNLYEIEYFGTKTKETHYVRGNGGVIATYIIDSTGSKTYYWFKDHLGSLTTITDSAGNVLQELSYDAWGKRRNADWTSLGDSVKFQSSRGFTGHEHYDLFSLVDMNGRIYDPVIGRFTSADPFIQDIYDLQSLNHYSYVLNNPLSYTDPSGFFWKKVFKAIVTGGASLIAPNLTNKAEKWVKENWKTIAIVTVAVATTALTGGAGAGFWLTVLSGAAAGFASNFTATMLYGGTISDALKSGAKGAVIGAVSAGLGYGVTTAASAAGQATSSGFISGGVKVVGNGIVQGGTEKANGGKFAHGFYSGAISAGAGTATQGSNKAIQITSSAAVGGTTSSLSGGKFANGAITGAYASMLKTSLEANSEKAEKIRKMSALEQQFEDAYNKTIEGMKNGSIPLVAELSGKDILRGAILGAGGAIFIMGAVHGNALMMVAGAAIIVGHETIIRVATEKTIQKLDETMNNANSENFNQ